MVYQGLITYECVIFPGLLSLAGDALLPYLLICFGPRYNYFGGRCDVHSADTAALEPSCLALLVADDMDLPSKTLFKPSIRSSQS